MAFPCSKLLGSHWACSFLFISTCSNPLQPPEFNLKTASLRKCPWRPWPHLTSQRMWRLRSRTCDMFPPHFIMTCLFSPTRLDVQHPGWHCTRECGRYLFLEQIWGVGSNGSFLCTGFNGDDTLATALKESTNQREQPRSEREAHSGEGSIDFCRRGQVT